MTDFFERQNLARRKTKLLLCYFLPSVALTILALYFLIAFVLAWQGVQSRHHSYINQVIHPTQIDWHLLAIVSAITIFAVTIAAIYKAQQLASGGRAVAAMLGGRRINNTTDTDELKLLNVVEEMAIASGVPVPEVYVLDGENSINAFVAGHGPNDAALGVTDGALRLLDRDELQAVVGHEFSHLLNGDMSLNLWLMSFLYGILFISLTGKFLLTWTDWDDCNSRRRGRGNGPILALGAGLFVIGSVGYFFGRLIKSAVSRQRECLADAASVQFTRNPLALAGALKKIGGRAFGSRILGAEADEASHMFFGDVMPESWMGMLSTHPPLEERIRILDPSFNGQFEHIKSIPAQRRGSGQTPPPIKSVNDIPGITRLPVASIVQIAEVLNDNNPAPVVRRKITPQHLAYSAGLTQSIPPEIAAATREPFGACALIYSILLLPDETGRAKQFEDIGAVANGPVMNAAKQYLSSVCALSKGQKLAVISLALPSLRQMSRLQFDEFSTTIQKLIESDSEISLFEYSLQKCVMRHLEPRFKPTKPGIAQYYAVAGLAAECSVLLSALAYRSSDDPSEISKAFDCGANDLDLPPAKQISLLSKDACNLPQIDAAVQKITEAALPVKRQVLNACALVVASDSLVNEDEAEMLRAIADAIGCPLPPFVSSIAVPEAA